MVRMSSKGEQYMFRPPKMAGFGLVMETSDLGGLSAADRTDVGADRDT